MKRVIVSVLAKPNSKFDKIERLEDGTLKVYTKTPPIDNKANKSIQKLLASYFGVAKSCVSLIKGGNSKNKLYEVFLDE